MAEDAMTGGVNGITQSDSSTQVRVHLSTQHPDIALPENPGPILVNTSNVKLELFDIVRTDWCARSPTICPFDSG